MPVGSGICKGLGVTVAWAKGGEGSVEEVGLGGLGEGQRGGGNCLSEGVKRPKIVRVRESGWRGQAQRQRSDMREQSEAMDKQWKNNPMGWRGEKKQD